MYAKYALCCQMLHSDIQYESVMMQSVPMCVFMCRRWCSVHLINLTVPVDCSALNTERGVRTAPITSYSTISRSRCN